MPSTGPPSAAKRRDGLHRGREAGDRAGAQVVAVGEAARDDDRVDAGEVGLLVPDQPRLADPLAGRRRASRSSQEPGNWRTPITGPLPFEEASSSVTISKSSISGLASSFSQSDVERVRVVGLELDQPPDPDVGDALEAERRQRPLDRLPLRIEDALLGPDQDLGLHGFSLASAQPLSRACAR